MRHIVWLFLVACLMATPSEAKDAIGDSVVKIHVTRREPDFTRPWSKANAQEATGSGVVIAGKRILTNCHMVLYANQILVQGSQSTERVPAKVLATAPGLDLALLQVDTSGFFDARPAVPLAKDLPALRQSVSVYGFPVGGEQLSITQGIISRIECVYGNYFIPCLRIQVDAAINPGNSGGPAIADGKLVGLVFSKVARADNIGYLIAAEEVEAFLKDVEAGGYRGKLVMWDWVTSTENEGLRARLRLGKQTGVLVYEPFGRTPDYPLRKWDVVTRIGNYAVDNHGNVRVRDDLRLEHDYVVPKLAKDGRVGMTVFRDGKTLDVSVPVRTEGNLAIPYLMGKYPRYFIFGPMVFTQATQELVLRLAASPGAAVALTMARSPLLARNMDQRAFPDEEVVVLGPTLLAHRIASGYNVPPFSIVEEVNSVRVRNLAHLVELLRDAKGDFLTIELAGRAPPLAFRREEAIKATDEILSDEGIRSQYSEDLESVWRKGAAKAGASE